MAAFWALAAFFFAAIPPLAVEVAGSSSLWREHTRTAHRQLRSGEGDAARAQRGLEHLAHVVDPGEVEVLAQVLRDVLQIGLVAGRRDDARDPGALGGQRLLLEAADR